MDHVQGNWVIGLLVTLVVVQLIHAVRTQGWLEGIYRRLDRIPKPEKPS